MATSAREPRKDVSSILTEAVQRKKWLEVIRYIEDGHLNHLSQHQRRWAVEETSKLCNTEFCLKRLITCCSSDMMEIVVRNMVTRGMWSLVGEALNKGVNHSLHRWAIDQACKHASDETVSRQMLSHCIRSQLNPVLTLLVERGMWKAVETVLKRGVSDSLHTWAIDQACKHASDDAVIHQILSHCNRSQLNSVLTPLVERGMWKAVETVLKRGVTHSLHTWAIDHACKHACDDAVLRQLLSHCDRNQLDSALTPLVERGLWKVVGGVLKQGVSDSLHTWAIDQACKHASDDAVIRLILPHCARSQLNSVLTSVVERGLWKAIGSVLQRGFSRSKHRWAIGEAFNRASDDEITDYILSQCAYNRLPSVLTLLVERGLWRSVGKVLNRGVSDSQGRWVIHEALKIENNVAIKLCVQPLLRCKSLPRFVCYYADFLLTQLTKRALWEDAARLLCQVVVETLYSWPCKGGCKEPDDTAFRIMVRNPLYGGKDLHKLCQCVRHQLPQLHRSDGSNELLDVLWKVLTESFWEGMLESWLFKQERENEYISTTEPSESALLLCSFVLCSDDTDSAWSNLLPVPLYTELSQRRYGDTTHLLLAFHFSRNLIEYYSTATYFTATAKAVFLSLASVHIVPDVQSVALRVLLRHQRWDVISHGCLTHVWELVRRQLFQAAVEQRQWSIVKLWADYSLYDDQRGWALEEAFREKQWDVFLLLADYGLTESEVTRVHYRLAKHAKRDTVLQMFERGADVTDMKQLLTGDKTRKAAHDNDDALRRRQRASYLQRVESDLSARRTKLKTLKRAVKRGDWSVVLFSLHRRRSEDHIRLALQAAVASGVWHVVRQLIKLGIDTAQRDSLFTRMVERRQWGVCMVLLEQGVSVELCLAALSELMKMEQWTLVARVMMDHNVDDAVRRQVLQRAMERRQGNVVWQCAITMQSHRLSVEEREELFQRALSLQVLQAIKPLIEEKNSTAVRYRDTVLPEAIDQHQWDVVDHCQLHHADIDMKDARGQTPMQTAAMKKDWLAVEALTRRGADPSLLDIQGVSVLHRAITAEQWDTVKLLIQFHGDIHQADRRGVTPLQMLINARQVEIIEHTLLWCPDQWKGVNGKGETTLHAACLSGLPSTLYYLVARGVKPFSVTKSGYSALSFAVLCKGRPQVMVAECVKLGFCTYQPHITDSAERDVHSYLRDDPQTVSPLVLSVVLGLPAVTQMLYESGSCSYVELFRLLLCFSDEWWNIHTIRQRFIDTLPALERKGFQFAYPFRKTKGYEKRYTKSVEASARYLIKVCGRPRSLKSSCRLVISRCVKVRRQRHREVTYAQLPLSEEMKNYVMFSDFTDPDYGTDVVTTT